MNLSTLLSLSEMISSGSSDEFLRIIDEGFTPPKCEHGNPFCNDEGEPLHPECGCFPNLGQITTICNIGLDITKNN